MNAFRESLHVGERPTTMRHIPQKSLSNLVVIIFMFATVGTMPCYAQNAPPTTAQAQSLPYTGYFPEGSINSVEYLPNVNGTEYKCYFFDSTTASYDLNHCILLGCHVAFPELIHKEKDKSDNSPPEPLAYQFMTTMPGDFTKSQLARIDPATFILTGRSDGSAVFGTVTDLQGSNVAAGQRQQFTATLMITGGRGIFKGATGTLNLTDGSAEYFGGKAMCNLSGSINVPLALDQPLELQKSSITVYLGGAGMNGPYISDQIAALQRVGVKNVVEGNFSWGTILDAIDVYDKRYHQYLTMDSQPFNLELLGLRDNGEATINFIGYSYGSLIAAQCAAYYAEHGRHIGYLVLIGSPISKKFLDELEELKTDHKIDNVVIVNLTQYTDQIYAGMSFESFDHISQLKLLKDMKHGWGHFYYAPSNSDGNMRRANLAQILWNDGLR